MFPQFTKLPNEIIVIIINYLCVRGVFFMSLTSYRIYAIVSKYALLRSRCQMESNKYCNYYTVQDVVGRFIYYNRRQNAIYFTQYARGEIVSVQYL